MKLFFKIILISFIAFFSLQTAWAEKVSCPSSEVIKKLRLTYTGLDEEEKLWAVGAKFAESKWGVVIFIPAEETAEVPDAWNVANGVLGTIYGEPIMDRSLRDTTLCIYHNKSRYAVAAFSNLKDAGNIRSVLKNISKN